MNANHALRNGWRTLELLNMKVNIFINSQRGRFHMNKLLLNYLLIISAFMYSHTSYAAHITYKTDADFFSTSNKDQNPSWRSFSNVSFTESSAYSLIPFTSQEYHIAIQNQNYVFSITASNDVDVQLLLPQYNDGLLAVRLGESHYSYTLLPDEHLENSYLYYAHTLFITVNRWFYNILA